jgi:prevent-host-death family protein
MFKSSWKLQDAKNHFSEVVDSALTKGPQEVTKRGKHAVVILSFELYQQLIKPKKSLVDFFQSSPLKGIELDLERQRDTPRDMDL